MAEQQRGRQPEGQAHGQHAQRRPSAPVGQPGWQHQPGPGLGVQQHRHQDGYGHRRRIRRAADAVEPSAHRRTRPLSCLHRSRRRRTAGAARAAGAQSDRCGHPADRAPHPVAGLAEMFDAVLRGATDPDITGVEVVRRPALGAGPADVLAADAILLGTPANIGYMSGALKHFFDLTYYPVLDATRGLPYGLYVHGNLGTEGAVAAVEQIASGLGWRAAAAPVDGDRRAGPGRAAGVLGARGGRCRERDAGVAHDPPRVTGTHRSARDRAAHRPRSTCPPRPRTSGTGRMRVMGGNEAYLDRARRLTIEQKAALCLGGDIWHTAAIAEQGIEQITLSDGPHGLRRQPEGGDHVGIGGSLPATCFPTAVRAGLVVEPGAGPGDRRRARRRGPGPGRRGRARPRGQHQALPAVRAQLRVPVRGPVPGRPAGRGDGAGHPGARRRRVPEALRGQQPGDRPDAGQRRGGRAHPARDLPARLRAHRHRRPPRGP